MFDVGSEIDNLASRLGQPGADLRAPAGMIVRWVHQDIRPLLELAASGFKDDAPLTPLLHLLVVAVGEIATQWMAVRDHLAAIEPRGGFAELDEDGPNGSWIGEAMRRI